MKKIALVLAVLLLVGGAAFAEVGVYFGAQAQTSVLVDLDAGGYALANSLFSKIVLTFGGDVERSGEGDVYGEINVTGLGLAEVYKITSGDYTTAAFAAPNYLGTGGHWSTDPIWTAKIIAGDFYLKVDGEDKMRARRDVMANVLDDYTLIGLDYYGVYPQFSAGGTAAVGGAIAGVGTFEIKAATASATAIANNDLGVAVDFSLTAVEGVGLDLSFVYGSEGTMGVGATAGYDVALDGMTVTPYGAVDVDLAASTFEAGGGLKVDWESDKDGIVDDSVDAWKGFFGGSQVLVSSGLDIAVKYGTQLDLAVTGAYFPVDKLNSAILVEMTDVLGTSTMGIGAYADYKGIENIKLFGWFKYTTALDLELGAEYLAFANTTIGVAYTNYQASGTDTLGDASVYFKVAAW